VAGLMAQSPPLAIIERRTVGANDPQATAIYGHRESTASFEFSDRARHCLRWDSHRYRSPLRD
jgi:hypothetical protein